ncbi:MAG: glycosyltransferase family 2 protein [bacterium]
MKTHDVVIVNYNGEKIISNCLKSIYGSTVKPSKVIIYDNASVDKSLKIIRQKFPQVKLIAGKTNIGFGRANNAGMKYCDGELILFMNNDVILDKNCTQELLGGFEDERIAIINPIIYTGWQKRANAPVYSFGAQMNTSGFGYGLFDQGDDNQDLNCFSGACFMARAKTIKKLQFEKRFFLYYEEPELSTRILIANLKIARKKKAKSYHLENYSSPKKKAAGICFRQFYAIQNRFYMIGRYWPTTLLMHAVPLNVLHLFYNLFFFIRSGHLRKASIIYLAVASFIAGRKKYKKRSDTSWTKNLVDSRLSKILDLRKKVYR